MRLFVVAELRVYREALARALLQEEHIEVVGACAAHADAAREIRAAAPEVLLIDVSSPEAMRLVEETAEDAPAARVIALSAPETESSVIACVEAGVSAFVPADSSFADLLATLADVECNQSVLSPWIASTLIRRVRTLAHADVLQNGAPLTARERQILHLIDRGLSNKEIARRLSIEVSTVKNHVHHILAKLDVGRRADAAAKARAVHTEAISRATY